MSTNPPTTDTEGEGRTRWGRSALLFVPSVGVVGVLTVGLAQGALAASFAVSGSTFKVAIEEVEGEDLASFIGTVPDADGEQHPVALAAIGTAEATGLCASTHVDTPMGTVGLQVLSGQDGPITGTNLVVDASSVMGETGTLTGVEAGRDASTLDAVDGFTGPPGTFGVQGDTIAAQDVTSLAYAGNGGSMRLNKLELEIDWGRLDCF